MQHGTGMGDTAQDVGGAWLTARGLGVQQGAEVCGEGAGSGVGLGEGDGSGLQRSQAVAAACVCVLDGEVCGWECRVENACVRGLSLAAGRGLGCDGAGCRSPCGGHQWRQRGADHSHTAQLAGLRPPWCDQVLDMRDHRPNDGARLCCSHHLLME